MISFAQRLSQLFHRTVTGEVLIQELEALLIEADVGPRLTEELCGELRRLPASMKEDPAQLKSALKSKLARYLRLPPSPPKESRALAILVLGVNGVGKTTTIAKLAYYFKTQGNHVLAIAGDTFRAAAIEQLGAWGKRVPFEVIAQSQGSDPAAVVFDGLSAARARKADVVLVDTAGRLHTKQPLIDELKKIERVMAKFDSFLQKQTYLILDATTGQNGLAQAKVFCEAVKIDAAILSKWDSSAKGGVLFVIGKELDLPIAFVGVGERLDDLKPFEPQHFIDELLA